MQLWHRFGLPLGSAFLTAAILDNIIAFYWLLIDGGSLVYFLTEHDVPLNFKLIFGISCFTARAILSLSIWIFVFMGYRPVMIFWIPLSIGIDVSILAHAIKHRTTYLSDEIWFLNIACVFLYRAYITSVASQCLYRLLKNEVNDIEDQAPPDSKYDRLEPLGKDIVAIWQYYDNNPSQGARVLLTVEIVWNVFCLATHYLTEFLLGGRIFFMIKEEEIIIRIWRIFLGYAGFLMVAYRKKTLLRFWLIIFFWTLFVSLCIYAYMLVEWSHETAYVVYGVSFYLCLGDNILRFGIIYFCLHVTTAAVEELSRRSSVRSQRSTSASSNRSVSIKFEPKTALLPNNQ